MKGTIEKGTREKRTKERESRAREDEKDTHTHGGILGVVEFKIPGRREREQQK